MPNKLFKNAPTFQPYKRGGNNVLFKDGVVSIPFKQNVTNTVTKNEGVIRNVPIPVIIKIDEYFTKTLSKYVRLKNVTNTYNWEVLSLTYTLLRNNVPIDFVIGSNTFESTEFNTTLEVGDIIQLTVKTAIRSNSLKGGNDPIVLDELRYSVVPINEGLWAVEHTLVEQGNPISLVNNRELIKLRVLGSLATTYTDNYDDTTYTIANYSTLDLQSVLVVDVQPLTNEVNSMSLVTLDVLNNADVWFSLNDLLTFTKNETIRTIANRYTTNTTLNGITKKALYAVSATNTIFGIDNKYVTPETLSYRSLAVYTITDLISPLAASV